MFDSKVLKSLIQKHYKALTDLSQVEQILNQRFSGMEEPIRALILSVASGEPLLLVGPPGTAKSKLIRAFCELIGMIDRKNPEADNKNYFEYLLTPFTEPGELFGYYDISSAKNGKLVRDETGMMQNAQVVYLDEVFNGSSAILNSILAFINERIFHDRGKRKKVEMKCLFAATNDLPESATLRAVYDRFVLRCRVDHVDGKPHPIANLLEKGWKETYASYSNGEFPNLISQLELLRHEIRHRTSKGELVPKKESPFYSRLATLVHSAREYDLSEVSNRRIVKMTHIMLIHRLYEAAAENSGKSEISLGDPQLKLFYRYFLDRQDLELEKRFERQIENWHSKTTA